MSTTAAMSTRRSASSADSAKTRAGAATSGVPARFVRAVDAMKIAPQHRVLEIGCGAGLAVSLVCEKLGRGRIVAIDRSAPMIALARKRNRAFVEEGKAELDAVALADADFGDQRFDIVFGFNVNAFWKDTKGDLETITSVLAPRGRLYVFYETPSKAQVAPLRQKIASRLKRGGFTVDDVHVDDLMITVVARTAVGKRPPPSTKENGITKAKTARPSRALRRRFAKGAARVE